MYPDIYKFCYLWGFKEGLPIGLVRVRPLFHPTPKGISEVRRVTVANVFMDKDDRDQAGQGISDGGGLAGGQEDNVNALQALIPPRRVGDAVAKRPAGFVTVTVIVLGVMAGGIVGIGASLIAMGDQFAQVNKTIAYTTGASGEKLEGLNESVRNIGKSTPKSLGDIATAYRLSHAADRKGAFTLVGEFDQMRARMNHLRSVWMRSPGRFGTIRLW